MKLSLLKAGLLLSLAFFVAHPSTTHAATTTQSGSTSVQREVTYNRRTQQARAAVQKILDEGGSRTLTGVRVTATPTVPKPIATRIGTVTPTDVRTVDVPEGKEVLQERSPSFDARLICRVRERYYSPLLFAITRRRLVERLAAQGAMPIRSVQEVLMNGSYCLTLWDDDALPQGTIVLPPSGTPQATGSGNTPSNNDHTSAGTNSSASGSQTGATGSGSSSSTVGDIHTDRMSLDEKLRMLCRIQQRLDLQSPEDLLTAKEVAHTYADQWNLSADTIEKALLNPELCTHPSAGMLSSGGSQSSSSSVQAPSPLDNADGGFLAPFASLPMLMKIVAGLIVVTFLVLIALLIMPKFQEKRPKGNGKK